MSNLKHLHLYYKKYIEQLTKGDYKLFSNQIKEKHKNLADFKASRSTVFTVKFFKAVSNYRNLEEVFVETLASMIRVHNKSNDKPIFIAYDDLLHLNKHVVRSIDDTVKSNVVEDASLPAMCNLLGQDEFLFMMTMLSFCGIEDEDGFSIPC